MYFRDTHSRYTALVWAAALFLLSWSAGGGGLSAADGTSPFISIAVSYSEKNYINRSQVLQGASGGDTVVLTVRDIQNGTDPTSDLKTIAIAFDATASPSVGQRLFTYTGGLVPVDGSAPWYCQERNDPMAITCSFFERQLNLTDFTGYFFHPDGFHSLNVYAEDNSGESSISAAMLFLDQYAPCDDFSSHTCRRDMVLNSAGQRTLAVNSNQLTLDLALDDGAGSGIETNGTDENLKIFIAYLYSNEGSGTKLEYLSGGGVDVSKASNFGKDCGDNAFAWVNTPDNGLISRGYLASAGSMQQPINLEAMKGAPIEDGTYWVFVCAADRAGNWTYLGYPAHSRAEPGGVSLCALDPDTGKDDTSRCQHDAWVPAMRSRFFVDRGGSNTDFVSTPNPDGKYNPSTCSSDPCRAQVKESYPSDGSYTAGSSVEVTWKNPLDLSGIETVYYRLSTTPPAGLSDMIALPRTQWKRKADGSPDCKTTSDPDWECFDLAAFAGGTLYLVVQDAAGNVNASEYVTASINIDRIPPNSPTAVKSETAFPTLDTSAQFSFRLPLDNGPAGIKNFYICWNKEEEYTRPENYSYLGCGEGSRLEKRSYTELLNEAAAQNSQGQSTATVNGDDTFTRLTLPTGAFPHLGRYRVTVWAEDRAGNYSIPALEGDFIRSDGLPLLNMTRETEDYTEGGVSPRSGTGGEYIFRVKYTDLLNYEPSVAQLWIDLDASGKYEDGEKFEMERVVGSEESDNIFADGTFYTLSRQLRFIQKSDGLITYRFVFKTPVGEAKNGEALEVGGRQERDLTTVQTIRLDPYDLDDVDGQLQVRNGLQNRRATHNPVALLKLAQGERFKLVVLTLHGRPVKTLAEGRYSTGRHRYIRWNLKNASGSRVRPGVYTVALYGQRRTSYARVIVSP